MIEKFNITNNNLNLVLCNCCCAVICNPIFHTYVLILHSHVWQHIFRYYTIVKLYKKVCKTYCFHNFRATLKLDLGSLKKERIIGSSATISVPSKELQFLHLQKQPCNFRIANYVTKLKNVAKQKKVRPLSVLFTSRLNHDSSISFDKLQIRS